MSMTIPESLRFIDNKLIILDQTKLPQQEEYIELGTSEEIWDAINKLKVRGAPAIGVAAAYGLYVCTNKFDATGKRAGDTHEDIGESADLGEFLEFVKKTANYIDSARPTAVNLSWAMKRMVARLEEAICRQEVEKLNQAKRILLQEAMAIHKEDIEACRDMGELGLSLLKPGMGILTHCNAGALATSKYGTCLSPIYLGHEKNYGFKVFADETRPLLQGARLTSWELNKAGVDVTLICDNMASTVMKKGWIDAVVVGCDRMAANGDGANKIGTSAVAILAKHYGIPFYMFVPTSTIDLDTPTGEDINIELRNGDEIRQMWYERPMAPEGVKTFNPSFDVTDAANITAVITEKGIVYPPYKENLAKLLGNK